ncbi:uncharacterized protein LOC106160957 [Lingula anatina]|uniref:Uncharacterized protein LOC106160957 n=1 Tax=Lingula anatina TaxID=7574 RepID=A0A1S3I5V5_LINAN|nr:uncharacterized protein LOC106160957 [Lingula anatina]|eukprot:XP_013393226.1 uncharacterized protein LOC106160957 [Lingula anatina]
MANTALLIFVFVTCIFSAIAVPCTTSLDCHDPDGRTLCQAWTGKCIKNVPCNKNGDCYFYAENDVTYLGAVHQCFKDDSSSVNRPEGYGTCMINAMMGKGHEKLPGPEKYFPQRAPVTRYRGALGRSSYGSFPQPEAMRVSERRPPPEFLSATPLNLGSS